ncbi:hypothetical protein L2E82_18559 [Cichorium intybus]|uniref:Uncharacterized protein n=1 Tax=Cichorium intybus TaxID=13427 RepID=A0ACB9FAQ6_CICIN|nr:hypothetical protein L2E82_18559 [Cichorium intybus]
MENSRSYVGVRWFTVAVMVLLLSTEYLQLIEAQPRCDPVELSWCLQAMVSNMPPSAACCRRLKRQEPCLCQEMNDPTFGGYLKLPGAKRVATACGVTFPTCRNDATLTNGAASGSGNKLSQDKDTLFEPSTRQAMQKRLVSAAATTNFFLRKGVSETKEKVIVWKTKVEEKGVASTNVFGVPIEVTVQRQEYSKPVPFLLIKSADYLVLSGLNSPDLFNQSLKEIRKPSSSWSHYTTMVLRGCFFPLLGSV